MPLSHEEEMLADGWVPADRVSEQAWYWWWNGDEDSGPVIVSVFMGGPLTPPFATAGQLGWTVAQDVPGMGGWWMKIPEPEIRLEWRRAVFGMDA